MTTLSVPVLLTVTAAVVVGCFASSSSFVSMAADGGNHSSSSSSSSTIIEGGSRSNKQQQQQQQQQGMVVAEEEMQRANYFAYVMLINMAPPELFQGGNVTFLMPNDKTLAKNLRRMPQDHEDSVADFLLRHSIPSPMLMEQLEHIPTGSLLPTSKPDLVLRITNKGRRSFFLNNVRIISPNICTLGSIRCHGIDGLIQDEVLSTTPLPPPSDHDHQHYCHNNNNNDSSTTTTPPSPSAAHVPSPPMNNTATDHNNNDTTTASPPTTTNHHHEHPKKSVAAAASSPSPGMFCLVLLSEFMTLCLTFLWIYY